MVKAAVARTSIDLEPIDRLEAKVKLLVEMLTTLRAEHERVKAEAQTLRDRLADAEGVNAELSMLRDERDVIRTRVTEMLQQLEAI